MNEPDHMLNRYIEIEGFAELLHPVWTCADKRTLFLHEMTTTHVKHSISWCERKEHAGGLVKDGKTMSTWIRLLLEELTKR